MAPVEQYPHSFADVLTETINTTNNKLIAADDALKELASGHASNLHQTMLTLEEAKLSFLFLEQIRNRMMNAYQDILREQI
jgi:flagellar hook-basal body complex protein FliE